MPEHLKALIVILALATAVFAFTKAPACSLAMSSADFDRRRNLWFAVTLAAFLAHNFWIFILFATALLLFALPHEPNKLAMFFFVLFAVPMFPEQISGFGIVKQFFTIDYVRLLALVVLLSAFLSLWSKPAVEGFGRTLPDKLLAGYLILQFLLMLRASTFTNSLRHGVFYAFIDVFLPYYVASRSLRSLEGFRDALMAIVVAALVLSAIAAFEFARHWLLYSYLEKALGVNWGLLGRYLARGEGGGLRALASTGHAIVLGYVMAVALGLFLSLRKSVTNPLAWFLGLSALIVGLIVPLSRGPWVGAAVIVLAFIATGLSPGKRFFKLGLLGLIVIPLLLISPAGQDLIDYLPFVGTVDADSVGYRQRLLDIAIPVIMQHPFFGAFDYFYSPAMQDLKQGQGIIDIVNSYLGVALGSGMVGLTLFAGFFVTVAVGIFKSMRTLADQNGELYLLGRVLFSTLLGILVIIFTVSSITVVPVIYWSVAGLGVAYALLLSPAKIPEAPVHAGLRPAHAKSRGYAGAGS